MPKVKTHSGAKKRFKKLKSGLFKAARPFRRHLLTKKSRKTKRNLRLRCILQRWIVITLAPLITVLIRIINED